MLLLLHIATFRSRERRSRSRSFEREVRILRKIGGQLDPLFQPFTFSLFFLIPALLVRKSNPEVGKKKEKLGLKRQPGD